MIFKETSLYGWGVCDILMPRASRDIHTNRRSKKWLFYRRDRRRKKSQEDSFWDILASILVHDFPRVYTLLVFLLSIFIVLLIYWISLIIPDLPDKEIVKPEEITIQVIEDQIQIPKEPEPPPVEAAPETPEPEAVQKTVAKPPVQEVARKEPTPKPVIQKAPAPTKPEPVIIKKQPAPKPKPVVVQKKITPPPKPVPEEILPEIVIQPKIVEKAVEKIKTPDKAPIVFTAQPETEIKLAPKMLSTRTLEKQKQQIPSPIKKAVTFDKTEDRPVDITVKPIMARARGKKKSTPVTEMPLQQNPAFSSRETVKLDTAPSFKRVQKKENRQPAIQNQLRKESTVAQPALKADIRIAQPDVKKKIYRRKTTPAPRTQKMVIPDTLTSQPESPDVAISSLSRPTKTYRGAISPVTISAPRDTEPFSTIQPAAAADITLPEADSENSRYAKTGTPRAKTNIIASGSDVNFKPSLNTEEIITGAMSPGRKLDDRSQTVQTFDTSDKTAPGFAQFLGYTVDSSHIISLKDLNICLDPEEAPELKTMLATLLDGPLTFENDDIVFSIQYPEDKYTIHLYIYNPTNKTLKDKCSALRMAIQGVRKIKK